MELIIGISVFLRSKLYLFPLCSFPFETLPPQTVFSQWSFCRLSCFACQPSQMFVILWWVDPIFFRCVTGSCALCFCYHSGDQHSEPVPIEMHFNPWCTHCIYDHHLLQELHRLRWQICNVAIELFTRQSFHDTPHGHISTFLRQEMVDFHYRYSKSSCKE